MLETNIDSFILRFVTEQSPEGESGYQTWHGIIRHVQTNRQIAFVNINEAIAFVANFVEIEGFVSTSEKNPHSATQHHE